jgi:hypothetical protein
MSSPNAQSAKRSADKFTPLFKAALNEHQQITRKRLDSYPFATQLATCNSLEAVSTVLRTQAQAFGRFYQGDDHSVTWLYPTIEAVLRLSATLVEGIGLVSGLTHFL